MTWYQVGIASKELQEIGWRTNMFPKITAVLCIQVGLMVHTLLSLKVWSLVESVILTTILTGTRQATTVSWVTVLESRTVELSSCMSYWSLLIAIIVIVVAAAQVSWLVCFLIASVNNQSTKALFRVTQNWAPAKRSDQRSVFLSSLG